MKQINETARRKKDGKNHNSKLKIEEIHYCIYINPSFFVCTADCSMTVKYLHMRFIIIQDVEDKTRSK